MPKSTLKILATGVLLSISPAGWSEIASASDQCADAVPEATPSSAFTEVGDGSIVRHEPTGLEWKRCALGQSWDGTTCQGSADTMEWQQALQAAAERDGWRLPDIQELRSIVETCRTNPAVNQEVFPNMSASDFWSASPYAGDSDIAWGVDFDDGADIRPSKSLIFRVRLVRVGQ